ncbi:hypothetical protein M6D93_15680 [Jatrophihabitans telluris]|uniref:DUF3592 domain-containing protein n=1 Tax=Jatrophihabitans telluris TaxID=2038343 RepID=A0ABY4QW96_9ACTN|nr:hypothetical protein [Jatrophihabitans telluris]UQX87728.1 hypothetical protein M6D93_15680 [Jatrophihabitans telluris]
MTEIRPNDEDGAATSSAAPAPSSADRASEADPAPLSGPAATTAPAAGGDQTTGPSHSTAGWSALQSAYQAEASGDLVAMSFPGVRRVAGWLFWVIFPVATLAALISAILTVVQHVGTEPPGIQGTYVANRSCARGICLVGGTFISADHGLTVTSLLGDPRWESGSSHKVIYDGSSAEVIDYPNWDPTPTVLAGVGALTYLGVAGYFLVAARRTRNRDPAPRSATVRVA